MNGSALSRRSFLASTAGLAAYAQQAPKKYPNVVIILADDQGWGDLSIHGNTNLLTSHIDSLARDGAIFEHFYVCAVCAPTRAEFLTGRYHARCGVRGVTSGAERLNLDEKTLADTFKAAGYATGAFGKWHSGSQFPYHPNARGFDEYYGFTSGHWGSYFDPELDHNGKLVRGKGYVTDDLTNHALDFIDANKGKPFLCYLPLNTPHSPMQVPDQFYQKFAHLEPKMRSDNPGESVAMTRAALAMCENIDWNVGRVLTRLNELKLAQDTIVLYFSDNGPNSWRWNGGMKGRKGSVDEGGVRVPCLVRWTGHIQPSMRVHQIAGAIDLLPTFADLTGISLASRKPLDGTSLKPLLVENTKVAWPDRMIFSQQGNKISVRTQQYRYDAEGRLFDMLSDPSQRHDLAAEKPDISLRLQNAVDEWRRSVQLDSPDNRPFTVGYSETTVLSARDGIPGGAIKRSSIHPNDSFFTNWRTTEDRMTWNIEVGAPGAYEAIIHYTCGASNIGSTVELSVGEAFVQKKITEAHDPPLTGAAVDRVKRDESYVKDFRPMRLGNITLKSGRGNLVLKALDVKGAQVADIRYIELTRSARKVKRSN
jgi:arylsulfatase A-like enzyme